MTDTFERIAAALEHIADALEHRPATGTKVVDADDRTWLFWLLRELAGRGDVQWTAADVIRYADGRPALFGLVEQYIGKDGAKSLGKRLAKLANTAVDGFLLERVGEDRGAALYCVRVLRVSKSQQSHSRSPDAPVASSLAGKEIVL